MIRFLYNSGASCGLSVMGW